MLHLELQSGEALTFGVGDSFIAKDYLPQGLNFDKKKHGHKAKVIGSEQFRAVHIKLNYRKEEV